MNKLVHSITTTITIMIVIVVATAVNIAYAAQLHVAVASNFTDAISTISERFETSTGNTVILSFGSSGKHYAQIKNGAPYDVFFSADTLRATQLEQDGIAKAGSRFTYAIGKLVLWSPKRDYVDTDGKVLSDGNFRHLAIANPNLAPYGKAAQETLSALGLWDQLKIRLVRGENIGQTFQFIYSGNTELGFIAYSQVKHSIQPGSGSFWLVPQQLYSKIEQQAVILKDSNLAREFIAFVRSDTALKIIENYGYDTP